MQENERFLPPTQIQTSTPYLSLKELSKQYSVPVEFIDYKLSNILTYYKNKDNVEPVFVPEENLSFFDDNTFYLDETLEIEQVYDVEFFDVRLNATPKLPKIDIGVNSTITKVIAKVRASKECEYEQHYEDKLYEYIAKQLMKAQILIGIRIGKLKEELKQIASIIHVKGELDKDYTLNLTQGINPKKAIDAKIIYYYKDKLDDIKEEDKVDYADRGFVFGVAKDEVIMEEKKSHEGANGRDVRGKLIEVPKPKEESEKEKFKLILVDLPGFGYAKVAKSKHDEWRKNLDEFLKFRSDIRLFIHLIDARHFDLDIDVNVDSYLKSFLRADQKILNLYTKSDKLNQSQKSAIMKFDPSGILVSTLSKSGIDKAREAIINHALGR